MVSDQQFEMDGLWIVIIYIYTSKYTITGHFISRT